MTEAFFHSDFANFTKVAQGLGFTPKYGILDDAIIPTTQGNLAAGRPPTYQQPGGFGVACNQVWMRAVAIDHAPALQRKSLADVLRAAKSFDTAYPRGPVDFTAAKAMFGGQFWRMQRFEKACTCWKVSDPAFHPRFR